MTIQLDMPEQDAREFSAWLLTYSERAQRITAYSGPQPDTEASCDRRLRQMFFDLHRQFNRELVKDRP